MLKIWGRSNSSNVQKVLWFCEEAGIAFERVDAGGAYGVTQTPEYLAKNPNSLVPTIEDDGFVLWESNTIARYLAEKHGKANWYPKDLRRRAEVEKWMDWGNVSLGVAITPLFWQLMRTPAEQRDQASALASAERTARLLTIVDAQVAKQPYLAGDHITLADVPAGIQVYRWMNMPLDLIGYERPDLPALKAWYERLTQRPVYKKVVMITIT